MRYSQAANRPIVHRWTISVLLFGSTVFLFAAATSLAIHLWNVVEAGETQPVIKSLSDYTYIGDDYPAYYPVDLPDVSFAPENTVHYQVFGEDAEREWDSLYPEGGGFLRLGPDRRLFGFALFHQMHCLARIRRAMSTRHVTEHVHHCLNYIRQTILCEANPTLEPVIPNLGRKSVDDEFPRVCRDWSRVYDLARSNYEATVGGGRAEL